jgi:hypothetical protein
MIEGEKVPEWPMSELVTLHPYDPAFVRRYVAAIEGDGDLLAGAGQTAWVAREVARARRGYALARGGNEAGANAVTFGLARLLATAEPVFFLPGAGLTQLEARFDRGIGMLLRPPSRLFADAGLEIGAARAMPIRLDAASASMGGAFLSPPLAAQFQDLLQRHMDRLARRMTEAELDAPAYIGLLLEAAAYAVDRGFGLYEAIDVVVPGVPASEPPGVRLLVPDRKRLDRNVRQRLEEASRPPKEPGVLARLFGRDRAGAAASSRDDARRWRGTHDVTPPPEAPDLEERGSWR